MQSKNSTMVEDQSLATKDDGDTAILLDSLRQMQQMCCAQNTPYPPPRDGRETGTANIPLRMMETQAFSPQGQNRGFPVLIERERKTGCRSFLLARKKVAVCAKRYGRDQAFRNEAMMPRAQATPARAADSSVAG
jgi:hypothetical protein